MALPKRWKLRRKRRNNGPKLTEKSPQPYLLNHADLHVQMPPRKTWPTCTNISWLAHRRQVIVRIVSRLGTVGAPVVGTVRVTTYLTQNYVHCLTTAMAHIEWVLSIFRKWPKFQFPLSVTYTTHAYRIISNLYLPYLQSLHTHTHTRHLRSQLMYHV